MSVTNGQTANQTTFNNAFVSKTANSSMAGLLELARGASGATITDTQKLLIQIIEALGVTGLNDTNRLVYSSHEIIDSGDDRKIAIGKLDAALKVLQDIVAQGSGIGGLRWWITTGGAIKIVGARTEYYEFNQYDVDGVGDDYPSIYTQIKVPNSYTSGQLFLKNGFFFSDTTSGNVLWRCHSVIYRAGYSGGVDATGHTSTNVQQAISGTTDLFVKIDDLDLTDSDGLINGVSLQAGDSISVRLYRDNDNVTSNVDDNVRLDPDSFEAKFE